MKASSKSPQASGPSAPRPSATPSPNPSHPPIPPAPSDGPQIFYLVHRDDNSPPVPADGDSITGRIYEGSSSGVWLIGDETVIEVKSWHKDHPIQSEPAMLDFIRLHAPSVPLPEPIFFRVDEVSNRSIFVMRLVKGKNLQEAWPEVNKQ